MRQELPKRAGHSPGELGSGRALSVYQTVPTQRRNAKIHGGIHLSYNQCTKGAGLGYLSQHSENTTKDFRDVHRYTKFAEDTVAARVRSGRCKNVESRGLEGEDVVNTQVPRNGKKLRRTEMSIRTR